VLWSKEERRSSHGFCFRCKDILLASHYDNKMPDTSTSYDLSCVIKVRSDCFLSAGMSWLESSQGLRVVDVGGRTNNSSAVFSVRPNICAAPSHTTNTLLRVAELLTIPSSKELGQQAEAEERDAYGHVVHAFDQQARSNNGSGDSDWCGRAQLKEWVWWSGVLEMLMLPRYLMRYIVIPVSQATMRPRAIKPRSTNRSGRCPDRFPKGPKGLLQATTPTGQHGPAMSSLGRWEYPYAAILLLQSHLLLDAAYY
jgi:hypothetical protein